MYSWSNSRKSPFPRRTPGLTTSHHPRHMMEGGISPSDSNVTSTAPVRTIRHIYNVRQPVSCEPCRRRKIKCSRTRPPCDTCRRRGCSDICVYKGAREDARPSSATPNQELLDRISNLETLLKKHTGAQISTSKGDSSSNHGFDQGVSISPMLSPAMDPVLPFQLSPASLTSDTSSHTSYPSETTGLHGVGILSSAPNGNVRYELRSSQWSSVLANTELAVAGPAFEEQDESSAFSGFPFISSPAPTMDELLSILPPTQQCDYLKNTYFTVFSPVRCSDPIGTRLTDSSYFTSSMSQRSMLSMPSS